MSPKISIVYPKVYSSLYDDVRKIFRQERF
jgi:hypothetical protein